VTARRIVVAATLTLVAGAARAETAAETDRALDRYQECFQKMIDANVTDNAFMRRCLGLPDKPEPRRRPSGELEHLGKDDAEVAVKRQLAVVRECYAKLLTQTKDLGVTPEGTVEARFQAKPDGTVDAVTFEPGSLTDVGLLSCVKEKLKAWTFPKTASAEPAAVAVTMRLYTAEGRQPVVGLPKGGVRVVGPGLSAEEVAQTFRKNAPRLRLCYDHLVRRKPKAEGDLTATLTVTPKGKVAKADLGELPFGDDPFRACLATEFKKWRFAPLRADEPELVKLPALRFMPRKTGP
jgi:hypothetical protein